MSAPARSRIGRTEAPAWQVLAFLAALVGASALGWALLAGAVWLLWLAGVYAVIGGSIALALAVVVLVIRLALKRGWRPKATAVAVFAALVALVRWVVSR